MSDNTLLKNQTQTNTTITVQSSEQKLDQTQQQTLQQDQMQNQTQTQHAGANKTGELTAAEQNLSKTIAAVNSYMPPAYESDIIEQLLASRKTILGDSGEMDSIKRAIRDVKSSMADAGSKVYTAPDVAKMTDKFHTAIKKCDIYINHPKKDKTNHRYYLVTEARKRLFEDVRMLEKAADLIADGTWAGRSMTMKEMISEVSKLPLNMQISNAQRQRDYMEEGQRARSINPKMNEIGFILYKKLGKNKKMEDNRLYRNEFEKGKDVWRKGNPMATYGDTLMMLRPVDFDETGKPASEIDRTNHEWNMKWFKAWEQDDFETREDMIAEQLPAVLDSIPMPSFKTGDIDVAKLSDPNYKAAMATKLEEWLDTLGAEDILKIYQAKNISNCISSLQKVHPSVEAFWQKNPVYASKNILLGHIGNFLNSYMKKKYGFQTEPVVGVLKYNEETEPRLISDNLALEKNYAGLVAHNYIQYMGLNSIEREPYKKAVATPEQVERKAKRVRELELKRRVEDEAYETKRHKDAFEQKVADLHMSADEEKAYRTRLVDAALDFRMLYVEMELYMSNNNVQINVKNNESRMISRKRGQKDNLPLLSDEEAYAQVTAVDRTAPDYYARVSKVLSDMNEKYDVSFKTMVVLENYLNMLEKQVTTESRKEIARQRQIRLDAQKKQPASFDLPPLSYVYQDKGQSFGQSCWARSGATIVNSMYKKLSAKDKSLKFEPINDLYFLGTSKIDYNEEARLKVNEAYKEVMGGENPQDDYLDNKKEIEDFRTKPANKSGNLFMMADYILKATDNRVMVKNMQILLYMDSAKESIKLLQDEFLNRLSVILSKNGGNPVSVLNGGHYITVTGIKGRNLIYKDSSSKKAPNKDFDTLSVEMLFSACKGKALEVVWLDEINDQTMKDVKEEYPEVERDYERLRSENQLDIPPEDYAHTKGIVFRKDIKKEEDPVLEGLITTKVYLPKGKPGEKVLFEGEAEGEPLPEEAQLEALQNAYQEKKTENTAPKQAEQTGSLKQKIDVEPLPKAVSSTDKKSDNTQTIEKLRAEKKKVEDRVREDVGKLLRWQASEHNALRKLKDRQEYTDKGGNTYPYLDRKFLGFTTHKETREEYILRVSNMINKKYLEAVERERSRVADVEKRINYYTDVNIVNTVDIEQIRSNYSEQSRQIMKKSLVAMAQSDLQRDVSPKYRGRYQKFMNAVIKYGNMDVDYFFGQGLEAKQNRQMALEEEVRVYKDMVKALDELEKQVLKTRKSVKNKKGEEKLDDLDANTLDLIKNYRDLFAGMAEGNLQIKEGIEVIKVRGAYYNMNGVRSAVNPMKDAPLFPHEPAISDITQGHLGDCYFVSTLASMVATDPALIKDSMKDNGDGTVTVRFMCPTIDRSKKETEYTSQPIYFNVPKVTLGAEGARGSIWVNCMELAYQQYKRAGDVRNSAITDFAGKLSGTQKRRVMTKYNRLKEDIAADLEGRLGETNKKAYDNLEQWQVVKEMEAFINEDPQLAELYRQQLDEAKLKEEKNAVKADVIYGGFGGNVFSIFTGKIHKTVRMGYALDRDKMNDLSFPYKDIRDNLWKEHPIEEYRSLKLKADSENAAPIITEIGHITRDITTLSNKIKKADDYLLKNPGKSLNAKSQAEYDEFKRQRAEKMEALEAKRQELKQFGFESEGDYDRRKNEWLKEKDLEGLADNIAEIFLANFEVKENMAKGESRLKAFMTMDQMRKKLGELDVNNLRENDRFKAAVREILTGGDTQLIYQNLQNMPNIEERITALAENLVKRFVLDAEKNNVLNHEHFSGYYSGEAENKFKAISDAIENHQAVVGGTFYFVGDRAEMEDTGEAVYDGIASTHEYSIIGVKTMTVNNPNYHKDGDERPTITHKFVRVRNPWADTHLSYVKGEDGKIKTVQERDNSTVGIEEIELNDFMNRFDKLYFASSQELRSGIAS